MSLMEEVDNFGFPIEENVEKKIIDPLAHAQEQEDLFQRIEESKRQKSALSRMHQIDEQVESILSEAPKKEKEEEPEPEPDRVSTKEFFKNLDDDALERFADGLLTTLGELEASGKIDPIENAEEAREALLAVVRQLYMKKASLAKMSRKFAQWGAKLFLRKQRAQIGKLSH